MGTRHTAGKRSPAWYTRLPRTQPARQRLGAGGGKAWAAGCACSDAQVLGFRGKGKGREPSVKMQISPQLLPFLLFGFSLMTTCPKGLELHRWREPLLQLPEPRKPGLSTLLPEPGGPALESKALERSSPAPGFVVSLCSTQEPQEGVRPPPVGR